VLERVYRGDTSSARAVFCAACTTKISHQQVRVAGRVIQWGIGLIQNANQKIQTDIIPQHKGDHWL
jgi:hypothetical protein